MVHVIIMRTGQSESDEGVDFLTKFNIVPSHKPLAYKGARNDHQGQLSSCLPDGFYCELLFLIDQSNLTLNRIWNLIVGPLDNYYLYISKL